jgi:hypothetical protein
LAACIGGLAGKLKGQAADARQTGDDGITGTGGER